MSFAELNRFMTTEFEKSDRVYHPSEYWVHLNRTNNAQIDTGGVENFKRTVVKHYFTWMRVRPWNPMIVFLVRALGPVETLKAAAATFFPLKHDLVPLIESLALNFMTQLTWRYACKVCPDAMAKVEEPAFGNPPDIRMGGTLISQDIANSVLEADAMDEGGRLMAARRICELGGGYGRTAYVIQRLHPGCQYVMVDIPPALAIAQTYMEAVFPEKRVFAFRPFDDFETVRAEIEAADIVCLQPHQLPLMPEGWADYFINISSLHEMRKDQIAHYVAEMFRLLRPGGSFFFKAWKETRIPFDDIELRFEDYPLEGWDLVYHRTARVQTKFFEALLAKPG
ncbi:MAG: putative sugar O-methyltransferase [Pseudomonadota bacterium]